MHIAIVYESMYGNTHAIADQVAAGFGAPFEVIVSSVDGAEDAIANAALVVVGGPTHAHSLTSTTSRDAAIKAAAEDDDLTLDAHAEDDGLRDWLAGLPEGHHRLAAAFDTRVDAAPILTGRASKGIAKRLRRHGFNVIAEPESFLVDKENHLVAGEGERARAWGAQLATLISSDTSAANA
ncbi:MAG: flavodoxin domain-containing protein [Microthrixaceae bacterium]